MFRETSPEHDADTRRVVELQQQMQQCKTSECRRDRNTQSMPHTSAAECARCVTAEHAAAASIIGVGAECVAGVRAKA
jgi:hypothetical protein